MRKLHSVALLVTLLGLLSVCSGCAGGDPYVIKAVGELKNGAETIMDEHDRMAELAGKPKLPTEYREDKLGAYDDLEGYLKGDKPKIPGR